MYFPAVKLIRNYNQTSRKSLGIRAKYVYACIPPVIGAITAAVSCTNDSPGYVCLIPVSYTHLTLPTTF